MDVRGIKAVTLVTVTAVLLSSCAKRQPDARLAALERAKDSIERTIVKKKVQVKAVEAAGFQYFQKADSLRKGWRALTAEERWRAQTLFSKSRRAEEKTDSLKTEMTSDNANLKRVCLEIEAAMK